MTKNDERRFLTNIPFLGYIFRKIEENRNAIEKSLNTGKSVECKTKTKGYLCNIIRVAVHKTFSTLKMPRKSRR